jgi:hypothetical protein
MTLIRFFPMLVAILEGAACLVYLYKGEWRLAVVWGGYTIAAAAFAGIR